MKRKLLYFLLSLFIILTACAQSPAVNPSSNVKKQLPVVQVEGDRDVIAKNLQELEDRSSIIIRGFLHEDAKQKDCLTGDKFLYGITLSSLEVTQAYKGEFSKGDIIQLGEAYYTQVYDGEEKLYCFGNYRPSEVNKEYLFFLWNPPSKDGWWSGIYEPVLLEQGRYPVLNKNKKISLASIQSMKNEEFNLGEDDISIYRTVFQQVAQKYMK